MNSYVKIAGAVVVLLLIVAGALSLMAGEPKTVALPELTKYKLKANLSDIGAAESEMRLLYVQWVNANPDAKKQQIKLDDLKVEQQRLVAEAFKEVNLSVDLYYIDGESMEFKKLEKK